MPSSPLASRIAMRETTTPSPAKRTSRRIARRSGVARNERELPRLARARGIPRVEVDDEGAVEACTVAGEYVDEAVDERAHDGTRSNVDALLPRSVPEA